MCGYKQIYRIFILLSAVLLLFACSTKRDIGLDNGKDNPIRGRKVYFHLLGVKSGTRSSAWKDPYDKYDGTLNDNKIITDMLKVYIGSKVGTTWDYEETEIQKLEDNRYVFQNELADGDYKLIVLANDNYTSSSFSEMKDELIDNQQDVVPMFGVKTFTVQSGKELLEIGNVDMLRSKAKVMIKLGDNLKADNFKIIYAVILCYNSEGYLFPNGWDGVENTMELDRYNCFRGGLNFISEDDPDPLLNFIVDSDSTMAYCHINELKEPMDYEEVSYLGVRISNGTEEKDVNIQLGKYVKPYQEYEECVPIKFIRNHVYQYTFDRKGMDIVVESVSWEEGNEHAINFKAQWGSLEWDAPAEELDEVVYMNHNDEYTCHFQIEAPLGKQIMVSFDTISGLQDTFVFVDGEGNEKSVIFPTVDSDDKVTLKVKCTNATPYILQKAKLKVAVIMDQNLIIPVPVAENSNAKFIAENPINE